MSINVIALFLPSDTPFYQGLFISLQRAFEQHGLRVVGGCSFLEDSALLNFINIHKPDLFFEMNRCKSEILAFPTALPHFCWLVDLAGRKLTDIKGSEHTYFFSIEWLKDYTPQKNAKATWLPPASDPENYYPLLQSSKSFTSVFIGHIPLPWSNSLLKRTVYQDENKQVYFKDVLDTFENKWAKQDAIVNNDRYIQEVINWINPEITEDFLSDKTLRYDIGCRIIRHARRELFLDWLINNTAITSLGIFGGKNWTAWEKYAPYYCKELQTAYEMNEVFNTSKTVIHEGVGFHFRLFDAMLSGVPLIIRKSHQDSELGGINTVFTPNHDYISLDIEKNSTFLDSTLSDPQALRKIAENAREKVLDRHTWFHRLETVIKDINALN